MTAVVTVAVPYHGCPATVRRAVDTILAQTRRDLVLVVVNDGDQTSPWPALDDVDDPRLVRFDLPTNRGRYFVDAVTATACVTPWWMPHDADDYSEPDRIAALVAAAHDAEVVFTPFTNHRQTGQIEHRPIRGRTADRRLRYTAHLSNLWATPVARALVHPGYRVAYDAVMTTTALYYANTALLDVPSYHRVRRPGSLVTSASTGRGSRVRRAQRQSLKRLWGRIRQVSTLDAASRIIRADAGAQVWRDVHDHAAALRMLLERSRV